MEGSEITKQSHLCKLIVSQKDKKVKTFCPLDFSVTRPKYLINYYTVSFSKCKLKETFKLLDLMKVCILFPGLKGRKENRWV